MYDLRHTVTKVTRRKEITMIKSLAIQKAYTPFLLGTLLASSLSTVPAPALAIENTGGEYSVSAYASESPEVKKIRNLLSEYNVPISKQESLIEKFNAGIPWDSINGTSPESIQTMGNREISRYPDGSISVLTISPDNTQATPSRLQEISAVNGCSIARSHYASYWNNCLATWEYVIYDVSIRFNYQNLQYGGASITNYWELRYGMIGGSLSNATVERHSKSKIAIHADLQIGNIFSNRQYVFLEVNGNIARTYN